MVAWYQRLVVQGAWAFDVPKAGSEAGASGECYARWKEAAVVDPGVEAVWAGVRNDR